MILVTVGCSDFKFDRLFKIIDELCDEKIIQDEIIAQTGIISYQIRNYKHFDYATNEEMSHYQDMADIVISHSGTGTVINCLKKNKKVIVFPRLKKYLEHTDNHQLDLSESFQKMGYILCAKDKEELIDSLKNIDSFKPKSFESNTANFLELIIDLIER